MGLPVIDSALQQAICRRAYEIWQREGRPEGKCLEHWQRAESEIRKPFRSGSIRVPAPIYFWDYHG